MNVHDISNMDEFILFIEQNGIDNSPYKFFGKHKVVLNHIKEKYGYPAEATIKEIYFTEINKNIQFECLNCGNVLSYNRRKNIMPTYCSSKCCSQYNKDMISAKRQSTMKRLMEDSEWVDKYKEKISTASREWNASPEGILHNKNHSKKMKELILSGKFTPNITNSWTRWKVEYNGVKYRSIFDALFKCYHDTIGVEVEYEKIRIPYEYNGNSHIYIVDYICEQAKTIYEIKPEILIGDSKNIVKHNAMLQWAYHNGYDTKYVSEDDLIDMVNSIDHPFTHIIFEKYPKWKR